jgi:hypothetical protein
MILSTGIAAGEPSSTSSMTPAGNNIGGQYQKL